MKNIPKTYDQIDQWKSIMLLYNSALKEINVKIEILNNEFIQIYKYNPLPLGVQDILLVHHFAHAF